ncbi:MAG: S-layer homology domain-containing protein, partial [Clostridia bacterium]|nr:S-layer homology domain-containing protein [Clostridia bacterium]
MKIRKILSLLLAALMISATFATGMSISAAGVTYSDVTEDMWSYDDIVYVTENGLMNGTGGSSFSPAVPLTRAMVVTVLYRMEGSPRVEFKDLFVDVK